MLIVYIARFLKSINWILLLCSFSLVACGFLALYISYKGNITHYFILHLYHTIFAIIIMFVILMSPIKFWFKVAPIIYLLAISLLIATYFFGNIGMGARRWINFFGLFSIQPSVLIQPAMILLLSKHIHKKNINNVYSLLYSLTIILLPVFLTFIQPDLGSAVIILTEGFILLFLSQLNLWFFTSVITFLILSIPVAWLFILKGYQKTRIITFLNPEANSLSSGYHTTQSKITVGSGGIFGKGFLHGTQGNLNFIPIQHTDFIFTAIAEEFGFIGSNIVIGLFFILIVTGISISFRAKNHFIKSLSIGMTYILVIHFCINIAMVIGIVPIVGIPLPFVSYGGSIMVTAMIALAFLQKSASLVALPNNEKFN